MFTGIVEGLGRVIAVKRLQEDMVLTIEPGFDLSDSKIGDSVSVDGVCLTITHFKGGTFTVDVSRETTARSTIGLIGRGDRVNLERAVRLADRLGGHLVSGHVDGMGKILRKVQQQRSWNLRIGIDKSLSKYTIEKGSITIDGISLTINRCEETFFEIQVIPQTAGMTHLLDKRVGDPVNIETDLIGKYVEKFFLRDRDSKEGSRSEGVNREMLTKYGFGE